jgi:hypothetical protein
MVHLLRSVFSFRGNASASAWMGLACMSLLLAGCALSTPSQRTDTWARQAGLQQEVVEGAGLRHVVYRPRNSRNGSRLHVYIEGDGSPWRDRVTVNADPTSTNPIMLRLLTNDRTQALYLGRPCYLGLHEDVGCEPSLWTHQRYSPRVVNSMAKALESLIAQQGSHALVFIGHSGGGTLATLLAARFPQTRALITLAGNLDIDAWCDLHGYSRLAGSLNPMLESPLRSAVWQRHYVGAEDNRVPATLTQHYVASHPGAMMIELKNQDHTCCWDNVWSQILKDLDTALEAESPEASLAPRKH